MSAAPTPSAGRRVAFNRMPRKTDTKRTTHSREAAVDRLEGAREFYLRDCYGMRTAARAEEFAGCLRLARPYLSRRVAELIGIPVRDFLRERQLAHAQRLLRTMPMSVEQIALASAFGTGSTFHRCFKAAFGITPSKYRAQVTKCE